MKNICFVLLSLVAISITDSHAETQSSILGNEPVKIAVLGMGVYNVVGSGEGIGALSSLGQVTEAPKAEKSLSEGFDFKAVGKHAIEQYKVKLSAVRKWQVVSAKELGKDEAIAKFALAVKDSVGKIPGSASADRDKWWTMAEDLPFIEAQWIVCPTCSDYQKAIAEAAKQFCAETGVDGVWLQSNYLGYGTKGASKFFSKLTGGSGEGTAIISVVYALIDKNGQMVFNSGITADKYRSEESFVMIGGAKAIDKDMMKFQMDALAVSAKEVADKVSK